MDSVKLQRKLSQWQNCSPEEMAKMSQAAIQYALADARADILVMAKLLCEAGYLDGERRKKHKASTISPRRCKRS